ncbi:putative glutathione S-transferase [Apodospora peruviana]|uniref:Glutathione S-transferase n=1 Tax=Apodospora peruviana TaxID=516989 RepID=A0AAE0IQ34_9PEZI|nr:putative glutathione S-transferase [Apodospora peruviana]
MADSKQIILFDLPTRAPVRTWSFNPWKIRFVLNYKGLDYKTQWVEYPDIKPTLENHVPPPGEGNVYTVPSIVTPEGNYIMDSNNIVKYLEEKYPEPPLHLDSPYREKVINAMRATFPGMYPIFVPLVPKRLLSEGSIEFFLRTREEDHGPLDELEKNLGGEVGWAKATAGLQQGTALLKENPDGPFFMGKEPSYADFIWGGFLLFVQLIGEDLWENFLKHTGDAKVHTDLLEALKPWSERCDH